MYYNNCNLKKIHFLFPVLLLILNSCSALFKAPTEPQSSTLGELTSYTKKLKALPDPKEKVVVAVYKFKDQTGQYKASENNANWSTAIPQGTTSILLKALEDSDWFTTIERENIGDLLNERQIIKSTRQEFAALQNATNPNTKVTSAPLPPLLFAGIIIEGGIVSYDTNIMTGGMGARYFGIGGSTQYRQDRISVYLRAVSTSNGKILKTVYTSKTILSQSISGNFFRYIDTERLLEAEIGVTKNEPIQLAVKEAIEKAVYSLILEGSKENLWEANDEGKAQFTDLLTNHKTEEQINSEFRVDNRILSPKRGSFAVTASITANTIKGDYKTSKTKFGPQFGFKFFLTNKFNLEGTFSEFYLENTGVFKRKFNSLDLNLEYIIMPNDNFSPYVYLGVGFVGPSYKYFNEMKPKANIGTGIEFIPHPSWGFRAFGEYDLGFNDDIDLLISGKRKDNLMRFGLNVNFYFGKKINN